MTDGRQTAQRSRRLDRDQLIERVDLEAVADRFLGPATRSPQGGFAWPCPHPQHADRASSTAPSLRVSGPRDGQQRWRCRPCGAYGTAIDLVMLTQQRDFRETLQLLDDLAPQEPQRRPPIAPARRPAPPNQLGDVEAMLAQVDLDELIVRLLGPGKRRGGRSRSWPCPHPRHTGQTGRTPPVTLFVGGDGRQRWHCHSCGAGGTAIDLVMVTQQRTLGEAVSYLRDATASPSAASQRRLPGPEPRPPRTTQPAPALTDYVQRCENLLWSPMGLVGREALARRGLHERVLRANRVGYDPGRSLLERVKGLPSRGPAIVLPVLDDTGAVVYLQARYLKPVNDFRYDNPVERLTGPSPRVAFVRAAGPVELYTALLCEGQMDALSAGQASYAAVAVLGAGYPDERVAKSIVTRFPHQQLVVAFDDNPRGHAGAAKLRDLLEQQGAANRVVRLVPEHEDLNRWLQREGSKFPEQLRGRVSQTLGAQPLRQDGLEPRVGVNVEEPSTATPTALPRGLEP